jgi:beta-N-acetylhexosaminidase
VIACQLVPIFVGLSGSPPSDGIDALLSRLSLEDKVGQILMITAATTQVSEGTREFLREVRPGGITLFRYHFAAPGQIRALSAALRDAVGKVPPFIAVDHEGGKIVRLVSGVPRLPGNSVFGAAGIPELARRAGRIIARALTRLGFNMNLAPVLDIPRGGRGRYLRGRAYAERPGLVARIGAAYAEGLQEQGVAAVAKHFPGEGTSPGDAHRGLSSSSVDAETLRAVDIRPFREAGTDAVMVGHIAFPKVDPSAKPASLSPAIYRLLRDELRFSGIALTDGLEMTAIRSRFGVRRAAVDALRAGADMLSIFWSPSRIREARAALLEAVQTGVIPQARLDEAVRRVLEAKQRRGILGTSPLTAEGDDSREKLLLDLGRAAATVVRGQGMWPLPEGTPVLSRVPEVLRAAGRRAIDLRAAPRGEVIRRARGAGTVVLVGGIAEAPLARMLGKVGIRVVALVSMSPSRARRFPASEVIAAWDSDLLAGALGAALGPRPPAASLPFGAGRAPLRPSTPSDG